MPPPPCLCLTYSCCCLCRIRQRQGLDYPTASSAPADPTPSAPPEPLDPIHHHQRGVILHATNEAGADGETRVDMVSFRPGADARAGLVSSQVHPFPGPPLASVDNSVQASMQSAVLEPETAVLGLPSAPPAAFMYDLAEGDAPVEEMTETRGRTAQRAWTGERYVSPPHIESRMQVCACVGECVGVLCGCICVCVIT